MAIYEIRIKGTEPSPRFSLAPETIKYEVFLRTALEYIENRPKYRLHYEAILDVLRNHKPQLNTSWNVSRGTEIGNIQVVLVCDD